MAAELTHAVQTAVGFNATACRQEDAHHFLLRLLGALDQDAAADAFGAGVQVQRPCPKNKDPDSGGPALACASVTVRHEVVTCVSVPLCDGPGGPLGPGLSLQDALQVCEYFIAFRVRPTLPMRVQVGFHSKYLTPPPLLHAVATAERGGDLWHLWTQGDGC